jgi:hypothetical protein
MHCTFSWKCIFCTKISLKSGSVSTWFAFWTLVNWTIANPNTKKFIEEDLGKNCVFSSFKCKVERGNILNNLFEMDKINGSPWVQEEGKTSLAK